VSNDEHEHNEDGAALERPASQPEGNAPGEDGAEEAYQSDEAGPGPVAADDAPRRGSGEYVDEVGREINVELRELRRPGKRRHRVREAVLTAAQRVSERAPTLNNDEVMARAVAKVAELNAFTPEVERQIVKVAPTSYTRARKEINRDVEVAAICRLPRMTWLREHLMRYLGGPRSCDRSTPIAVLLHMVLGQGRPQIMMWWEKIRLQASAMLAWAHLYPGRGPTSYAAVCDAIHKICDETNPDVLLEINAEHVRELIGEPISNARGVVTGFTKHKNALRDLLVDATLIEADLPQTAPKSAAHARLVRGLKRTLCGFVIYNRGAQVIRKCHGYKLMVISDLATNGRPLMWMLCGADVDERAALRQMLPQLFALFPELQRMREITLTGDALYDHSYELAYELTFKWGITTNFARHGSIDRGFEWADNRGVPQCGCRADDTNLDSPLLDMVYDQATKFPRPGYRFEKGLVPCGEYIRTPRGKIIDNARIRWTCPKGRADHREVVTYPKSNPRLYTRLPHSGDSTWAARRVALSIYRNVIESTFAVIDDMGLSCVDGERPRWAYDSEMRWICGLSMLTLTARHLIQQNGVYDATEDEASDLGLLVGATAGRPSPGPADRGLDAVAAMRREWIEQTKAPNDSGRWPEIDVEARLAWWREVDERDAAEQEAADAART